MFNEGRTNVQDGEHSDWSYLITDELKGKAVNKIKEDRHFMLDSLHVLFPEIITIHFGYKKMCARWIPRLFSDDHKKQRMGIL